MKKSNFITSGLYMLAGVVLLILTFVTESRLESLLFGFASACIALGLSTLCRAVYWSSPGNRERYEQRLENEQIERHDELKEHLRNRSGCYAYLLGILVLCISIVVFSVLGSLGLFEHSRFLILYLGGYLVFEILAGIMIFKHLLKKY